MGRGAFSVQIDLVALRGSAISSVVTSSHPLRNEDVGSIGLSMPTASCEGLLCIPVSRSEECRKRLGQWQTYLDLHQESHRFSSVEQAVIVGECEIHHLELGQFHFDVERMVRRVYRSDFDLAIDDHRPVLDGVQAKHSSLRQVDDRGAHH